VKTEPKNAPLVKVCGIASAADGRAALSAGADLLGFVLAQSPRRVTVAQAAALVRALRAARRPAALMVGVFKDQPVAEVLRAARRARFDVVQLHGAETPAEAARLAAAGFRVVKVIRSLGRRGLWEMRRFPAAWAFLLEPPVPGPWRGTARTADWRRARAQLAAHPRAGIAGNLSPANVARALGAAGPRAWLADAASTLERSPGVKDLRLVRAFVAAAKKKKKKKGS
jgi:phosphoribosylanthranilate isomerase